MQVKCQWCKNKDEKETMTSEQVGKQNKYYHPNCYDQYLIDKEFKQQERLELDSLVEIIKRVHDIKIIPNQFYPYLQQLRNDDVLFGKLKKQYKQGVSYKVITDTYEYCQKDIAWAKGNKDFNGTLQELKYGLAIIKNKIDQVLVRQQQLELEKERSNRISENKYISTNDVNYKKKNDDELDISEFL